MSKPFFDILCIEETVDLNVIKKAYRSRLKYTNPEDDAEGFKRLREAYEEACQYAKTKKQEKKELPLTKKFENRCLELYEDFSKRRKIENWKALFDLDCCVQLDTAEEIKKTFLQFLMTHYQLPERIWKLIDRTFEITGSKEDLMEYFPENYVDFLLQAVRYHGTLNYDLFGDDVSGEIDAFIENYHRLRQYTDLGMDEEAQTELEHIAQYGIDHPYVELERVRLALYGNTEDQAGELLKKVWEEYPTEERIACCYGQYLQSSHQCEEAEKVYEKLLSVYPESVQGRIGKAEILLSKGEFHEAREMILDLLEYNPQDERLMKDLNEANRFMIKELKKNHNNDQGKLLTFAWCYYQNMELDQGLHILDTFEPDEEHILDYHNLKGRIYLTQNKNAKALKHLILWLEEIKKVKDDGTKKTKRKLIRLGYAYYTIGSAKASLILAGEKSGSMKDAIAYLDKAVEVETDAGQKVSYYHTEADIWRQLKEYTKVYDVCEKMLKEDPQYYPAFLLRQESSLKLEQFQGVVEDYQKAVALYPYYGKPYANMIKMYFLFGEYKQVKEILDLTKERKIESDELKVLEARWMAVTSKNEEELTRSLEFFEEVEKKGWSAQSDIEKEDWSEIAYRKGLVLVDLHRYEEAKAVLEEALKYNSKDSIILYSYGMLLLQMKQYTDALQVMKQVLKIDSGHIYARHVITEIYERLGRKYEDNSYYNKAVPYMKEQLAMFPEVYYYIEMGLLYLDMDRYKKALGYFEKAIELDPNNVYAYNNSGNCYQSMNQPEKAILYYEKAIMAMGADSTTLPYNNLAKCYRMLGDYENAKKCYLTNLRFFPDNYDVILLLGDFYREFLRFDEAVDLYKKGIALGGDVQAFEFELLHTYAERGDTKTAKEYGVELQSRYAGNVVLHQLLGEIFLYAIKDPLTAVFHLKKALHYANRENDKKVLRGCYYLLGRAYRCQKLMEESRSCFEKYLEVCRDEEGQLDTYADFYGETGRRRFRIGITLWFLERYEESEKYFQSMHSESCRCDGCGKRRCYEKIIGKAFMTLSKGERAAAVTLYKKALENVPNDLEHLFELEQLEKMEVQK